MPLHKTEKRKAIYIKFCAECPYEGFHDLDDSEQGYSAFCDHAMLEIDNPIIPNNKEIPDWCPLEWEEKRCFKR